MFTISSEPARSRIIWAVFVAVGLALYLNSATSGFHFDDVYNIELNSYVHQLKFFKLYFTDSKTHNVLPENAPYRPLCTLTYALLWWIGGGATWPYHLFKILAHASVAWLIFLISRRLLADSKGPELSWRKRGPGPATTIAALGAGFFLIHPGLSETVNYISSTSTLQSSLLVLAGFWAYLRKRRVGMAALFLSAALTKEEGAIFPFLILAHQLVFGRHGDEEPGNDGWDWKTTFISWGTFALYLLIHAVYRSQTVVFSDVSRTSYFLTQLRAWVYYLAWVFAPWGYSIEHLGFGFNHSLLEPAVLGSAVILLLLIGLSLRWAFSFEPAKRNRFLAFCSAWYFIGLLPASSIFPLAEPINEHRYYLSYALLFPALIYGLFAVAATLGMFKPFLKIASYVFPILAISLMARTFSENQVWENDLTLWQNVVEKDPTNWRAKNNLGVEYLKRGDSARGLDLFLGCLQLMPTYPYCHSSAADAFSNLGQFDQAESHYQRALELAPNGVNHMNLYARFLFYRVHRPEQALELAKKCVQVSKGAFPACIHLASEILNSLNRPQEALEYTKLTVE